MKVLSKRYLLLEDGTYFEGSSLGGNNFKVGDVVFNTNMFLYQDILSNPAYGGKLITMTYPMIGNYGINSNGFESKVAPIFGFIISECAEIPGNYKSQVTLEEFLKLRDIPAIKDVDTRMIARHLRDRGSLKGVLTDSLDDIEKQVENIKNYKPEIDMIEQISVKNPFHIPNKGKRIILIDLGDTNSILKNLNSRDLDIVVVPYDYSYKEIEALHPNGVIISNGPSNPEYLNNTVENIKNIIGKYTVFGIGLGHNIIAIAYDFKIIDSKKASFGSNYPVKNLITNKVKNRISTNSYYIDEAYIKDNGFKITYRDIKDDYIEGLKNEKDRVLSISFIPEDEEYIEFIEFLENKENLNA